MATGTFDSLNPYTLKGNSPYNTPGTFKYGVGELNETLLTGTQYPGISGDEPQTAYGLIAQWIEYPKDLSWVRFHLRPEARFHDGSPITADDVVFSFHTLIEKGHPQFQNKFKDITKVNAINQQLVEFTLSGNDRKTLPLRIGEMPVLSKTFWSDKDFEKSLNTPPLLSGPYKIKRFDWGKFIEFERVEDYWGKDLAVNKGRFNFNTIRIDFYRDLTVAFEAFKAKNFDVYIEYISKNWATGFDFPALNNGEIIKEEIPHQTLAGSQGYFMNTRRELFKDVKVREALGLLFDFEWTNTSLFYGAYQRSNSYFASTELAQTGLPEDKELELLTAVKKYLPEQLFKKPFKLPVTDGSGQIRRQIRQALALLKQAGWQLQKGTLVNSKTGQPFKFEILVRQPSITRVLNPYVKNLSKVGIQAEIRVIDPSQYKQRMDEFDFDMTTFVLGQTLTPGHEQRLYFHSSNADVAGSLNLSGVNNPAVDFLVEQIIEAETRETLVAASKALDRVLLWHHYMIPNWHISHHRVAYRSFFKRPANQAKYDLAFDTWWVDKNK
ncbi:ABC transporter substrate-binding protein [Litoribrevibacter albus]|uniref:ABC transporter substrate-binding protein n=2 Tax=Litoribrevibacter albus TaxID=1473156 RepID=A0AA37W932_9GAMM|nr:ABC transporter substrate-binding protein [Litoribrevibacter albus]